MSSKPDRVFPVLRIGLSRAKKPLESSGYSISRPSWARRSEPPGAIPSVPPVHARAAIAVHTALHPAVPPAVFAAEPAAVMGQQGQAALLAVVERLVERVGRVGDLLQRRCRSCHVVGLLAQARHRIVRLLLILRAILGLHPRVSAIDPQLDQIAYRSLDRR